MPDYFVDCYSWEVLLPVGRFFALWAVVAVGWLFGGFTLVGLVI